MTIFIPKLFITFELFTPYFLCFLLRFMFISFVFLKDPSVTQVRQAAPPGLEEYNPFTDGKPVSTLLNNPVAAGFIQIYSMRIIHQIHLKNINRIERVDLILKKIQDNRMVAVAKQLC